jgi:tRNA pseudouridine13 synthase
MKLKHRPEDFQVDEQLGDVPRGGAFGLYRLTKRGLGTPEAIRAVCTHWRLRRDDVSYCGLKDRHAQTAQWVAIRGGPRRNLRETNLELVYVDAVARALESTDIAANRFRITLRDLLPDQVPAMAEQLAGIARDGLPNYFDRQRFGSLGESGEFMARAWCERQHERALWLGLADPTAADRPADRTEKQLFRDRWGQWEWLAAHLPSSPRRDAAAWLAGHPGDFRRAVVAIPVAQRRLHIEAFQSFLWNHLLAALLHEVCPSDQLFERAVAGQAMPFCRQLDDAQRSRLAAARLPLPSSRTRLEEGPLKTLVDTTLAAMDLRLRDLEIRYPRDSFFSKGDRAATFLPQRLGHEATDDELHVGRRKLVLEFDLPRGCYATILVGRLTEG